MGKLRHVWARVDAHQDPWEAHFKGTEICGNSSTTLAETDRVEHPAILPEGVETDLQF